MILFIICLAVPVITLFLLSILGRKGTGMSVYEEDKKHKRYKGALFRRLDRDESSPVTYGRSDEGMVIDSPYFTGKSKWTREEMQKREVARQKQKGTWRAKRRGRGAEVLGKTCSICGAHIERRRIDPRDWSSYLEGCPNECGSVYDQSGYLAAKWRWRQAR